MPRPLRVQYEGARYHVMCRGNRGTVVFGSDDDVRLWLKTLGEVLKRADWTVHAYVMMSTHYHLLLETPQGNLVEGMKWFQGAFTQRMNAMHQTWGHLFQGRYKAKVIDMDDPEYFRKVSEYIHLNPAAAGCLGRRDPDPLKSYPWSSYGAYGSVKLRPAWLTTQSVLAHYGLEDTRSGRRAYHKLMEQQSVWAAKFHKQFHDKKHFGGMDRGWVHGSSEFRNLMKDLLIDETDQPVYDSEQRRELSEHAAIRCIRRGAEWMGTDINEFAGMKKSADKKILLAGYLKEHFSLTNKTISRLLHMGHPSQVGRSRTGIRDNRDLRRRYLELEEHLSNA